MGRLRADFTGDVAIVTGSALGIGREIVIRLAAAGAKVHGFDVAATDPGTLDLPEDAPAPIFHAVDVRDAEAVEQAVEAVLQEDGRVDHLVNCAGITRDRVLWKMEEEDWQSVLDVNLSGAWRVLRSVAQPMRESGGGRVVQIASVNGLRGRFGQTNYTASKAGLIALTRSAARELGRFGIAVNAVAPGMIETRMTDALPEEVRTRSVEETVLGRLGLPQDVADAVLFLLSDQASHVTGAVLRVDGGQLA